MWHLRVSSRAARVTQPTTGVALAMHPNSLEWCKIWRTYARIKQFHFPVTMPLHSGMIAIKNKSMRKHSIRQLWKLMPELDVGASRSQIFQRTPPAINKDFKMSWWDWMQRAKTSRKTTPMGLHRQVIQCRSPLSKPNNSNNRLGPLED